MHYAVVRRRAKFRANGHFGPKRALLGLLGAQKGPDTRSKCVVSMSLTQTSQSGAVGTKSGTPGPSEDLRGPKKGILRPKQAFFACFWPFSRTGWFQMGYNSAG